MGVTIKTALGRAAAVATAVAFVGLPHRAQAAPFVFPAAGTATDDLRSSSLSSNEPLERLAVTPDMLLSMKSRDVEAEDTKTDLTKAPAPSGWFDLSRLPFLTHDSLRSPSGVPDKAELPPVADGDASGDASSGHNALHVGGFESTSDDSSVSNYFGETLNHDQAASPAPEDDSMEADRDDAHDASTEVSLPPGQFDAEGAFAFSKSGAPVVSAATGTVMAELNAGGVVLSAANNELVTVDTGNSDFSIVDLIGDNDGPLDSRHALLALEVRHALIDMRDTLSDISQALEGISLIPHSTAALDISAENGTETPLDHMRDQRRKPSGDGADTQYSDKIIHIITSVSLAVRDYFWVPLIIYLAGLTLRWALKRR